MRGLLGAALVMVLSCGPGKDDAVRVREGQSLDGINECPGLICNGELVDPPTEFCAEVLFSYGRSPPLCLPYRFNDAEGNLQNTCDLFECLEQGKKCVLFDGVPVQLRCIDDD